MASNLATHADIMFASGKAIWYIHKKYLVSMFTVIYINNLLSLKNKDTFIKSKIQILFTFYASEVVSLLKKP